MYTNTDSLSASYSHTHTDEQKIKHKDKWNKYTPLSENWIWECIIWPGHRNVARCFISVQAWSLCFCLWMLSSCSSTTASTASVLVGCACPLLPFLQINMVGQHILCHSPAMNCAVVTRWHSCLCIFTQRRHTDTHTHTHIPYTHTAHGIYSCLTSTEALQPECLLRFLISNSSFSTARPTLECCILRTSDKLAKIFFVL